MSAKPKPCKQSHTPENADERRARLMQRRRKQLTRPGAFWPNRSKYVPHQGKRECARRFVRMFAA